MNVPNSHPVKLKLHKLYRMTVLRNVNWRPSARFAENERLLPKTVKKMHGGQALELTYDFILISFYDLFTDNDIEEPRSSIPERIQPKLKINLNIPNYSLYTVSINTSVKLYCLRHRDMTSL